MRGGARFYNRLSRGTDRATPRAGTARASLTATASLARTVRSTWSATRSIRRTRSGSIAHWCLSVPNSRSPAPRLRYRAFHRSVSRGISVCSLSVLIQTEAGEHSPEEQRYLAAPRLASAPAKVHAPCSHDGGAARPDDGCLPQRNDGPDSPALALPVEGGHVVPAVSDGDGGSDAVVRQLVEQSRHDGNLSVARRTRLPRDRKAGASADRGVDLVAVDPPPLRVEIAERWPQVASGSMNRLRSGPWL